MKQNSFTVTARAFTRIAEIAEGARLRIAVDGGGCSGFQYRYIFDKSKQDTDIVINSPCAEVVVDNMSLDLLHGAQLDYTEDLGSAGFKITNPNAKARCGCGNSFAI